MIITSWGLVGARQSAGGLTTQKWKNKTIARQKPTQVENPRTPAQQFQRAKMRLLVAVGRVLSGIVQIGFKSIAVSMTEFNQFISNNIKTAITGTNEGNAAVDYSELKISKGSAAPNVVSTVSYDSPILTIELVQPSGVPVPDDSVVHLAIVNGDGELIYSASDNFSTTDPREYDLSGIDYHNNDDFVYLFYVRSDNGATSDSLLLTVDIP